VRITYSRPHGICDYQRSCNNWQQVKYHRFELRLLAYGITVTCNDIPISDRVPATASVTVAAITVAAITVAARPAAAVAVRPAAAAASTASRPAAAAAASAAARPTAATTTTTTATRVKVLEELDTFRIICSAATNKV
jgi:hypothetical protein